MTGKSAGGQAEVISRLDQILSNQKEDHDMLITLNECVRGETGLISKVKIVEDRVDAMKKLSIISDAIVAAGAAFGTFLGLRQ